MYAVNLGPRFKFLLLGVTWQGSNVYKARVVPPSFNNAAQIDRLVGQRHRLERGLQRARHRSRFQSQRGNLVVLNSLYKTGPMRKVLNLKIGLRVPSTACHRRGA